MATAVISIHAPREGSDRQAMITGLIPNQFQSTLPVRGATVYNHFHKNTSFLFQSTLPVRGATYGQYDLLIIHQISIHAPREGSDLDFEVILMSCYISIHAPREGSDPKVLRLVDLYKISIHAPREGSDLIGLRLSAKVTKFQSTLPVRGAT